MKKSKSIFKMISVSILGVLLVLLVVFLIGRYGWKLGGFDACESAGIESVEVAEDYVRITGFNPSSFPSGFIGYYAKQQNDTLYVGFKFSGLFGFFETGDFTVDIPVEGEITKVVMKTSKQELTILEEKQ